MALPAVTPSVVAVSGTIVSDPAGQINLSSSDAHIEDPAPNASTRHNQSISTSIIQSINRAQDLSASLPSVDPQPAPRFPRFFLPLRNTGRRRSSTSKTTLDPRTEAKSRGCVTGSRGETESEGSPSVKVGMRHGLMAAHLCLLLFSSVFTGIFLKQHRLALLAHCALTVAFLIYVPAAFTLTLMKGRNAFDHAGGEIAYLVIQQIGLSVIGTINAMYVSNTLCESRQRTYSGSKYTWSQPELYSCQWSSAILGLSFAHVFLLLGWMIWVIVLVYRQSPKDPKRAFRVSTAGLLRGPMVV